MNRPVWGILLFCVMTAASGCGSDKSEPGAKADPASGSTSPTAAAEGGSSQAAHLLTDNVPKKSSMEGRWILVFYRAHVRDRSARRPGRHLEVIERFQSESHRQGLQPHVAEPAPQAGHCDPKQRDFALEMTVQAMGPGQTPTHETKMLDVLVELRDGVARGSAQFQPQDSFVVAMVPTEVDNIQSMQPKQLPEAVDLQTPKDSTPEQVLDKLVAFVHAPTPRAR